MMADEGIPIRSPFRPLQQAIHRSNKDRLKDSPMDFSYDSPSHLDNNYASTSSWLNAESEGGEKRSRESMNASTEVFAFGSKEASARSSGTFLFHQPCTPTVAGPDVEMMLHEDSTPAKRGEATNEDEELRKGNHARPVSSSGALTRIARSRNTAKSRSNGTSESRGKQPHRSSSKSRRRKGKRYSGEENDEGEEWEDDEAGGRSAMTKRNGDTLTNIQYVFGGGRDEIADAGRHHRLSWMDPEWCLGMAQVAFNSTLLLGLLWLFFGVVRTLQRDVADKVREYELEFLSEIEACSHSYHLNKCGTDGAVPALATACSSWQKCAAKDPAIVGRSRVAAETVAEIVNGFVDVVSWKSMFFTLLTLIIVVGATNSTLSFFRLRSRKAHENGHPTGSTYQPAHAHQGYLNHMYHQHQPHLYSAAHWLPDPPSTPSTKRMCR